MCLISSIKEDRLKTAWSIRNYRHEIPPNLRIHDAESRGNIICRNYRCRLFCLYFFFFFLLLFFSFLFFFFVFRQLLLVSRSIKLSAIGFSFRLWRSGDSDAKNFYVSDNCCNKTVQPRRRRCSLNPKNALRTY